VYTWIEDYWLKQSHTITATRIAEPLSVDGPAVVAPGKSATFTGKPWGDLRLRNKAGILPRVWWVWWPGDTTAVPNPYVRPEVLPCDGQSCTYAPAMSGRLRVQTHVEGAPVEAERIVKVAEQRLELTCPASVQRAATVRCTVTAVPAGTLDSLRWAFVDTAGNTTGDSTGHLSWGGTMVVGGRMAVSARLNGMRVFADTPIVVSPRVWTSPVPRRREFFMRCQTLSSTCFQLYPPTQDRHLGTHLFQPRGVRWQDRAATVTDGPNRGWSYLSGTDSPVRFDEHLIVLNDILNPSNNDSVSTAWWAERPQCDRAAVLEHVRGHERHHADLFDRRRHIVNAEAERAIAFVSEYEWRMMLLPDGEVSDRLSARIHAISGGGHTDDDGFASGDPCDLEISPNP
jgi:hypothetical protein